MDRITNYATLVTAIQDLVDLAVGDSVDGFIQLTEQDINRRLDTLWQERSESFVVTLAGTYFDTSRRGILRVSIGDRTLERLHIDEARSIYRNWSAQEPQAYSLTGGDTLNEATSHILFWPSPPDDTTYTALVAYKLVVPELTSGAPTNWVLSVAPDAYLYGAAGHAVTYNGDETSLALYEQNYQRALTGVIAEAERYHSLQRSVSPPGAGGYENWLP